MSHTDHLRSAPVSLAIAILTVSDTRTPETDTSGSLIRELAEEAGHTVADYRIVPDDPDHIRRALEEMIASQSVEVVLLSGGTGISGRDRTYEAVTGVLDMHLDGYGEIFRQLSYQEIGAAAMLSRAVGGVASGKPVFSIPGSTGAVRLALEKLILPEIGHVASEASRRD